MWGQKWPFAVVIVTAHGTALLSFMGLLLSVMHLGTKDLRGNPKTRVSSDRTETSPGSGHVFENIFRSGRGIFYQSIIYSFLEF